MMNQPGMGIGGMGMGGMGMGMGMQPMGGMVMPMGGMSMGGMSRSMMPGYGGVPGQYNITGTVRDKKYNKMRYMTVNPYPGASGVQCDICGIEIQID